jgi:hypothetical protein
MSVASFRSNILQSSVSASWRPPLRSAILLSLTVVTLLTTLAVGMATRLRADEPVRRASDTFRAEVMPILKRHCIKCHGVSKQEGELQLHSAIRIWKGGESGAAVVPKDPDASLLWTRVRSNEMPPAEPLTEREKGILRDWISEGARGLPADDAEAESMKRDEHWAFTQLAPQEPPPITNAELCQTPLDNFVQSELEKAGIAPAESTDRRTLIRRVAFTLTGLPPAPAEIDAFVLDEHPRAVSMMIDRYLASPQYGVRWGRHWLDAAGYADSNGYFNADSDRPLAWQYRDYVVRSINADKPFDQFVREQIAGDELSGFNPEAHRRAATAEMIDMLIATHYLRNGQDGSGESDGNPDEVRIDRYTALESAQQIVASSLLGLTFQCAKCHDHKFEPLTQTDFYQFQSVFFPAYNPNKWMKPNERVTYASLPGVYDAWDKQLKDAKSQLATLQQELKDWSAKNRPPELVRFTDTFEHADQLTARWSHTIPGDNGPAGVSRITLLSNEDASGQQASGQQLSPESLPAAVIADGKLKIIEGGLAGDKWLSTTQKFDWTPEADGHWIQLSFALVDTKSRDDETPAERIAYGIALHNFDNSSPVAGGNILIDGNPAGGASVHLDYPGPSSTHAGNIGSTGYVSGKSYGVRVTRMAENKFQLQHLVDGLVDGGSIEVTESDLPNGSFAFGLCCGRSFQVDDVIVEASFAATSDAAESESLQQFQAELQRQQEAIKTIADQLPELQAREPGRIAWVTDTEPVAPDVFLLDRGEYSQPKHKVTPAPISVLNDEDNHFEITAPLGDFPSSGRRLAWAQWVTRSGSRAASLMARVQVNRVWQQHFGTGLVSTPENLGMSGSEPSSQALLDWLASEFIRSGWSLKSLHRMILESSVFQRSSAATENGLANDPYNRLLWRYSIRRLDAEALRDAQLAISGDLDPAADGPYVPTTRNGAAEVIVPENQPGAFRRSIYLQQRRSQGLSLLNVFDAPTMVINCTRRPVTTMPLQSLTLLNSEFAVNRGRSFAKRLQREVGDSEAARVNLAWVLATGHPCSAEAREEAIRFIHQQQQLYSSGSESPSSDAAVSDGNMRAWSDFCQLLLASNACLYLE